MTTERGSSNHRTPPLLWAAAVIPIAIEVAGLVWWLRWRFLRYEVAGQSMTPALAENDWIIADRGPSGRYRPRPGHVVLFRDPEDRTRILVKRVGHIDLHGNAWLLGDNAAVSRDSRVFGPVPPELIFARARWRYWPFGQFTI